MSSKKAENSPSTPQSPKIYVTSIYSLTMENGNRLKKSGTITISENIA